MLGGYTTFSLEIVQLMHGHARRKAVLYLAVSIASGVLLFAAGYQAAVLLGK